MFQGDSFKEGQTKCVTLGNLSEKRVESLLKYLYCVDSDDPFAFQYDPEVCMELLAASEEYSMSNLQETVKGVFMKMRSNLFQVDTAL